MDIESIPEIEDESDGDKDRSMNENSINTLEANRIQTEYGEDDQEFDYQIINDALNNYKAFAGFLLGTILLMQFHLIFLIPVNISIIPLALFEIYKIIFCVKQFIYEREIISNM